MKLRDLLRNVDVVALHGDDGVDVTAVVSDSRLATKGALFVAVPGLQQDGTTFVDAAIEKGASVIVTQTPLAARQSPLAVVKDARAALSIIAANFYGNPADQLSLIGVTGTSGKTTTTRMIESIFDAGGEPAGLIGTIEYRAGDERLVADRTTPDAVVLQQWFAKMVAAGVHHAVMEVSSHALALKRTYGVRFAAAVFTNLSRDHFDFHKDFEDYFAAKKILFTQIADASRAVVNADDEYGRRLIAELGDGVVTFGRRPGLNPAHIRPADDFEVSTRGLHGVLHTPHGAIRVESSLLGAPNLSNWMAAVGAALVAGIGREQIEAGIRNLRNVRGRFERVDSAEEGPTVIVDYAHKPDALEKLLHAVRHLAEEKRLIVVFGCGGDRDKGKRPQMGEIAARLADEVVITSDNPRSEKPQDIINDIAAGITNGGDRVQQIADRREAIAKVIDTAPDASVIVIAGKGHEAYQVIRDQVVHFDDREEAELALLKRQQKHHEKTLPKSR